MGKRSRRKLTPEQYLFINNMKRESYACGLYYVTSYHPNKPKGQTCGVCKRRGYFGYRMVQRRIYEFSYETYRTEFYCPKCFTEDIKPALELGIEIFS